MDPYIRLLCYHRYLRPQRALPRIDTHYPHYSSELPRRPPHLFWPAAIYVCSLDCPVL
jgi:hypothetical protein